MNTITIWMHSAQDTDTRVSGQQIRLIRFLLGQVGELAGQWAGSPRYDVNCWTR